MNTQLKAVAATVLAGALASAPALTHADATLERNLESAHTLIEKSSVAQRIEASGNAAALAERERARALHAQARDAAAGGDAARANELLGQAKQAMFKAVQMAGAGQVSADKAKHDYDARAASVKALLMAQGRVADEKAAGSDERGAHSEVASLLARAEGQAARGDYRGGIASLDTALQKLRTSIEHMRGGDTLELKLDFKTKEDEFRYYWDKTASQLEAIGLAKANVKGTSKEAMIDRFAEKMADSRAQAKALADRGDYEGAIAILAPVFQQAPFQLMSALR